MRSHILSALVLALSLGACGAPEPGGPIKSVVPKDATHVVLVPNLDALRVGASSFTAGLDGAAGLVDLIAERYGLDFRSPEALDASGLDARGGAAIFRPVTGQGTAIAVSVHRPDAFIEHAALIALRALGARPVAGGGPSLRLYSLPNDASPRLAIGVTDARVGLILLLDRPTPALDGAEPEAPRAPPPPSVESTWRTLAALSPDSVFKPLAPAPEAGQPPTAHLVAAALPEALLAAAGSVAASAAEGLGAWTGGLDITPERVGLMIAAPLPENTALPVDWVKATTFEKPLAGVLPLTTPLFMRFSYNSARLRGLPGFVRDGIIPARIPGLEAAPMPDLPDLVPVLGDELGLAVFGLEPGVPLAALMNVAQLSRRWPRLFRFALIARVHDREKLVSRFDLIASQFEGSSEWTVLALAAPENQAAFKGWTFVRGDNSFAVLIDDDIVTYVSGAAEVENLMAVRAGRVLPLSASVESSGVDSAATVTRWALGLGPTSPTLGVHMGFLRATRELVERGAPPYFIKVLNSIHSFAAGVGVHAGGIALGLEVRL